MEDAVNGITMHEALKVMIDAEMEFARSVEQGPSFTGVQAARMEDAYNAMCSVICIEAEQSGNDEYVKGYGCDDVCGEGFPWSEDAS